MHGNIKDLIVFLLYLSKERLFPLSSGTGDQTGHEEPVNSRGECGEQLLTG